MTLALPGVAQGKDNNTGPVEGVVVQVKEGEMIVDVGVLQGLPADAIIRVYRRVEVAHPVSGKIIVDRFPIGTVILDQVGKLLSISTLSGALRQTPSVGDFVVYEGQAESSAPNTPFDETPAVVIAGLESTNPDRALLDAAFDQTLGMPFSRRILIWTDYLHDQPDSPYIAAISRELEWLHHQKNRKNIQPAMMPEEKIDLLTVRAAIPREAFDDDPLEINASVVERDLIQEMRVLIRHPNDPGFETIDMARDGDFNWRVTLDERWMEPGEVELFIEAIRTNGVAVAVTGDARSPRTISVTSALRDVVNEAGRSRADIVFEWVDFSLGAKSGHQDSYLRFESQYRYLVDFGILKTFTVGVGQFIGEGASVAALDRGDVSQTRTIMYGSAKADLEIHPYLGISARINLGNGHLSGQDTSKPIFGTAVAVRIGEYDGTSLQAGISGTEEIGNEGWITFVLNEIPKIPISAGVVATNLPVGEDIGVSLQVGAGYQFNDFISLSLRTGWNARTINNWGLTVGSGLSMTW